VYRLWKHDRAEKSRYRKRATVHRAVRSAGRARQRQIRGRAQSEGARDRPVLRGQVRQVHQVQRQGESARRGGRDEPSATPEAVAARRGVR